MEDGYYWVDVQDGEGPRVVQVKTIMLAVYPDNQIPMTLVLFIGTDLEADILDYDQVEGVKWVGPLEVPKEFTSGKN